jgi:hypothetical protein
MPDVAIPDTLEAYSLDLKDWIQLQAHAVRHAAKLRGIMAEAERLGSPPNPFADSLINRAIADAQHQADVIEQILTAIEHNKIVVVTVIPF